MNKAELPQQREQRQEWLRENYPELTTLVASFKRSFGDQTRVVYFNDPDRGLEIGKRPI